ncbi:MAG: hypothetical protein IH959_03505 [Chloroflexi bacterium]|nr:hypothetical protein [Chloroflexota bacterium]
MLEKRLEVGRLASEKERFVPARRRRSRPDQPREPTPPGPEVVAAPPGGPYLQQAFFCEKILREADGVVSFIRQVDRLTVNTSGPEAPPDMPQTTFTAFLAIAVKAGEAKGRHELKVLRELPSGIRDPEPLFSIALFLEGGGEGGGDRGAGILGQINMVFEQEGLYWFDVYLDETLLSRIPFRVIYQRSTARAG